MIIMYAGGTGRRGKTGTGIFEKPPDRSIIQGDRYTQLLLLVLRTDNNIFNVYEIASRQSGSIIVYGTCACGIGEGG